MQSLTVCALKTTSGRLPLNDHGWRGTRADRGLSTLGMANGMGERPELDRAATAVMGRLGD